MSPDGWLVEDRGIEYHFELIPYTDRARLEDWTILPGANPSQYLLDIVEEKGFMQEIELDSALAEEIRAANLVLDDDLQSPEFTTLSKGIDEKLLQIIHRIIPD